MLLSAILFPGNLSLVSLSLLSFHQLLLLFVPLSLSFLFFFSPFFCVLAFHVAIIWGRSRFTCTPTHVHKRITNNIREHTQSVHKRRENRKTTNNWPHRILFVFHCLCVCVRLSSLLGVLQLFVTPAARRRAPLPNRRLPHCSMRGLRRPGRLSATLLHSAVLQSAILLHSSHNMIGLTSALVCWS